MLTIYPKSQAFSDLVAVFTFWIKVISTVHLKKNIDNMSSYDLKLINED